MYVKIYTYIYIQTYVHFLCYLLAYAFPKFYFTAYLPIRSIYDVRVNAFVVVYIDKIYLNFLNFFHIYRKKVITKTSLVSAD